MTLRRNTVLIGALLLTGAAPSGPAPGPLHIIGAPVAGCLAGAVRLPDASPGIQTIHRGHSSFWGAPQTIARVEQLGREVHDAGLGDLYVDDISRPRGGPIPGGHEGHQIGLEADVGLDPSPKPALGDAARETVEMASMVRPDLRGIEPSHWSPQVIEVLHLAASLPDVDRILVNPAIKQALCQQVTGDRGWLRLIRPWYDHSAHMHIRFRCPADQHDCEQMAPPPPGDSCDATLQWWFDQLNAPPKPPGPPSRPHSLPAACTAVMQAPG
jgi:penicillin-insensitive murein endopeptidase